MKFPPSSATALKLRKYGVHTNALSKTNIYALRWLPVPALTIPIPFSGCTILIKKGLIEIDLDKEIIDGPMLSHLVHRLGHAHQRFEWGLPLYLWRHFWSRISQRTTPISRRQVERECYQMAEEVSEYHSGK